ARRGCAAGPRLAPACPTRPDSHSLADDATLYRRESERQAEARRDPIPNFAAFLTRSGAATAEFLEAVRQEIDREVDEAAQSALEAPKPDPSTVTRHVYLEEIDP